MTMPACVFVLTAWQLAPHSSFIVKLFLVSAQGDACSKQATTEQKYQVINKYDPNNNKYDPK